MKFWASFKTPNAANHEGFIDQAEREVMRRHGIEDDHIDPERDDLVDEYNDVAHRMAEFAGRWVKYGETVVLEFDMEKGTCRVVET